MVDKIKILVAEDHLITLQGICRLLEDEKDLEVVGEAKDGETAVRMTSELKPDVVIMDVAMPKVNGIEATKQIKALFPRIAVLILSAYDDDEYVLGLLEAGAAGYLLKTTGGEDLIRAIMAVHKGEPVLDPKITRKVMNHFRLSDRAPRTPSPSVQLGSRELDIIGLAARGMSNKDIATQLHLSRRTVEGNIRTIFNKLGVSSRTEAVIQALARGMISMDDLS